MGELPDADVKHTAPHDEESAPESVPAEHHSHCFQKDWTKVIVFAHLKYCSGEKKMFAKESLSKWSTLQMKGR